MGLRNGQQAESAPGKLRETGLWDSELEGQQEDRGRATRTGTKLCKRWAEDGGEGRHKMPLSQRNMKKRSDS